MLLKSLYHCVPDVFFKQSAILASFIIVEKGNIYNQQLNI
jgi:hypothetical protein